jgi:hypothetical protein
MKRPLVVFVFSKEGSATSTRYGGFAKRLQQAGALPDCDVLTVALENLVYVIDEQGQADVFDSVSGQSMGEAALVYLKSWEAMPEEAAALTIYLQHKGVQFADTLPLGMGVSKLAAAFRLWTHGLAMPATLYVRRHDRLHAVLQTPVAQMLGDRIIIKDSNGEKGNLNFLHDRATADDLLSQHPGVQFVCQRFVPNEGDYRIGVYGQKASFVLQRIGSGESHLNNTSAGGQGVLVAASDMPVETMDIAERAAAACRLQIGGVDIIVDSETGKPFVLEVNQGSQIVTGAFKEENTALLATALNRMIAENDSHRPHVIGRRSHVAVPELGVILAVAKIDSGAYNSSLHAENIHVDEHELVFTVTPSEQLQTADGQPVEVRTSDYTMRTVRSSNGAEEQRFAITSSLHVGSKILPVTFTLTDRGAMKYPLLIGRKTLAGNFLINVALSEHGQREVSDSLAIKPEKE